MPSIPSLACPRCRATAEYQTTIEIIDPPVGKIDVGYCAECCCLFEFMRQNGTAYESTAWPPVCRACRQPVVVMAATEVDDDLVVRYQCRDHASEVWESSRRGERWKRS